MTQAPASHSFELAIFTQREGLLSRFGHDLVLALPATMRKHVASTPGSINVEIDVDLTALQVRGAMVDGVLNDKTLSRSDREKIASAYAQEVMHCRDFPRAFFRTTVIPPLVSPVVTPVVATSVVEGHLELHGHVHPLSLQVVAHGAMLEIKAQIQPSRWGIAPYRAMAGTLRVADQVVVSASLPLSLAA